MTRPERFEINDDVEIRLMIQMKFEVRQGMRNVGQQNMKDGKNMISSKMEFDANPFQ